MFIVRLQGLLPVKELYRLTSNQLNGKNNKFYFCINCRYFSLTTKNVQENTAARKS